MRLIDADELVKTLSEEAVHILKKAFSNYSTAEARGIVMAIDSVKKAPTIEPVKRGKWVGKQYCNMDDANTYCANCSECGVEVCLWEHESYCPNCGANMDGGME